MPAKEDALARSDAAIAEDRAGMTCRVDCAGAEEALEEPERGNAVFDEDTLGIAGIVVVKTPPLTVTV